MVARVLIALCVCALSPQLARAQVVAGAGGPTVAPPGHEHDALLGLGQNYPNPFSPATRIPFSIGNAPFCNDQGRQYRVSLKVYNLLAQLVAVPTLVPSDGVTVTGGSPVQDLELTCGQYTAYWNGNYLTTSREVASGMYLYRLEVNGKAVVRKMFVLK